MSRDMRRHTAFVIRDLHARESMRLGWYRVLRSGGETIKALRARKARHTDYLLELLRKRDLRPVWYAKLFYRMGFLFGLVSRWLPEPWIRELELLLEQWILLRYRKYLRRLKLDDSLRSMVEAMQMRRFSHAEPGADVLELLHRFITEEEQILGRSPHLSAETPA
jgi:demethoxyubiquinone hydroxylase (CLK1/Coq7/Cat5 family)